MATLSRPSSRGVPILAEPVAPELSEEARPVVSGPAGALVMQWMETVNVYITIVNGSTGAEPPLLTVQGS